MGEFSRSGGPIPRPLGDEINKEHHEDIREAVERDREAEELLEAEGRPPWYRRLLRRLTHDAR